MPVFAFACILLLMALPAPAKGVALRSRKSTTTNALAAPRLPHESSSWHATLTAAVNTARKAACRTQPRDSRDAQMAVVATTEARGLAT